MARRHVFVRTPGPAGRRGRNHHHGRRRGSCCVERAVTGCDAVVHLVWSNACRGSTRYRRGTSTSCKPAVPPGFAASSSPRFPPPRTRDGWDPWQLETPGRGSCAASGIPFVILRPSLVYGGGETGLVASLARHLRTLPVMPVIGNGRIALDPVHLDDLCDVMPASSCATTELSDGLRRAGSHRVTLNNLVLASATSSASAGRCCRSYSVACRR